MCNVSRKSMNFLKTHSYHFEHNYTYFVPTKVGLNALFNTYLSACCLTEPAWMEVDKRESVWWDESLTLQLDNGSKWSVWFICTTSAQKTRESYLSSALLSKTEQVWLLWMTTSFGKGLFLWHAHGALINSHPFSISVWVGTVICACVGVWVCGSVRHSHFLSGLFLFFLLCLAACLSYPWADAV